MILNEQGGSSNIQELSVVKEENGANEAKLIDCVAAGARPKPTFSWFIGEEELNAEVTEREENEKDNKKDYISTLSYYPGAVTQFFNYHFLQQKYFHFIWVLEEEQIN